MRYVVAVFGGSHPEPWAIDSAREIGREIAIANCIVLTGAGPDEPGNTVKGAAISRIRAQPWIGIDRARVPAAIEHRSGFVLSPAIDHRRNYVEACICHAAVCLPGEAGTTSEATFALALQRPVAFWGDAWRDTVGGLDNERAATVQQLIETTITKVGEQRWRSQAASHGLERDALLQGLATLPPYRFFGAQVGAGAVMDWLLETLQVMNPQPVSFVPPLPTPGLAESLSEWLGSQT